MEQWNLYDKHRNLLPDVHIRGQKIPEGMYHLVVHVCVFNSEGKILICQRTDDREVWPSYWDVSAAGSALLNETSAQAAQRETYEETWLYHDFEHIFLLWKYLSISLHKTQLFYSFQIHLLYLLFLFSLRYQ